MAMNQPINIEAATKVATNRINKRRDLLGNHLEQEFWHGIEVYEILQGRPASRLRPMIKRHGVIEACRRMVASSKPSTGFDALVERGKVELSTEHLVVKWRHLFDHDTVQAAKTRLASVQN